MESQELLLLIDSPEKLDETTLPAVKKMAEDFPYFQAGWMLYLKNLKGTGHSTFNSELGKISVRIGDRKKLYNLLNPPVREQVSQASVTLKNQVYNIAEVLAPGMPSQDEPASHDSNLSLIDKFIRSAPNLRITGKTESLSANADLSKESVMENEDILSETYAGILIQQKKYDKAIEAFEKLSLKFPEKNIYFAARIEEVNNLKYTK